MIMLVTLPGEVRIVENGHCVKSYDAALTWNTDGAGGILLKHETDRPIKWTAELREVLLTVQIWCNGEQVGTIPICGSEDPYPFKRGDTFQVVR